MVNRRFRKCIAGGLRMAFLPWSGALAESAQPEYRVKAAIVYKVAKFVSWPSSAFDSNQAPLVMCITGKDPFGQYIDNLDGKNIRGRPLVVRRVDNDALSLQRCHVVFVPEGSAEREILAALRSRPVLTIGDSATFAETGGVLGLSLENNRIAFEINLDAAKNSGLDISASLLQLSKIIGQPAS